ncbi:MAG: hypothetical protein Q9218_005149 [Villophora microphyllina]
MAPQTSIPPVANILGTIGTICCKWRTYTTTLLVVTLCALYAGLQILLVFLIRPPYHRGLSWPVTLVGVIATVLLITGYVPIPFEVWKRRGRVVGIDFVFLTIDWLGAFFSLMAIATQNTFDILGGVMYIMCATIEAGIVVSQVIWLIRTRVIRQRAKEAGKVWEDFPEAQAWQENRLRFSHRRRCADAEEEKGTTNESPGVEDTSIPKQGEGVVEAQGEKPTAEV